MNLSRYRRRTLAGVALLGIATVGLSACGSSGGSAASTNGTTATSITVWTAVGPDYDWQKALLSEFTQQTGIKVNYEAYPETSFTDKLTTAQQAKSNAFSVFESPQSSTSQYNAYHAIAPLTSFLASTPASYDKAGIPAGETGQCTLNGTIYCLPVQLDGGPQMFYNKAMFAAAHIAAPPSTWSQVVSDAGELTTSAHAGICMRGSEAAPNGYPVLLMLPYYLPYSTANKGEYLDPSWKPLFNTPQAVAWGNDYATLMTKYAPRGVGAYDYTDCVHAFQTGKVAMFWDDASLGAELWDPSQSATAAQAGFDEIPCPPANQTCLLSAPWGMYVNPNVPAAQQRAAWKYLEFMTSPSIQLKAFEQTKNPDVATRPATLTYAIAHAGSYGIPADFLTALRYGIQHIEDNAIPVTAAFSDVQSQLFVVLSEMISGQLKPAAATTQLQSQMTSTLHRFNLGG
jgi:ABC-type glycerol-3-phosphate transport system substrate-binding protein